MWLLGGGGGKGLFDRKMRHTLKEVEGEEKGGEGGEGIAQLALNWHDERGNEKETQGIMM